MRLVKIDNILLNFDNVVMIKGISCNGGIEVYAYTQDTRHLLGACETKEDYNEFIRQLSKGLTAYFPLETLAEIDTTDEDKELWV